MQCPTVKIKADNEQGFIVINADDFDLEKHILFEIDSQEKKEEKKRGRKKVNG